jgi:hypothetical protein
MVDMAAMRDHVGRAWWAWSGATREAAAWQSRDELDGLARKWR